MIEVGECVEVPACAGTTDKAAARTSSGLSMSGPASGGGITLTPSGDSGQALALSHQGRGDWTRPQPTGEGEGGGWGGWRLTVLGGGFTIWVRQGCAFGARGRAVSSVGESACFTRRRSLVRVQHRPP